ncbi:MAG: FAA hydrolase family protein, partial [Actinomycetota bacterium]|nr:FAA hydrolase family protein [Actinomycetota bacterium]
MRLLSFSIDNKSKFGIATVDGVIDLTAVTPYKHLGDLLEDLESLSSFSNRDHDYTWEQIKFDIPITDNRRLLCAGLNYHKKYPLGGEVKA